MNQAHAHTQMPHGSPGTAPIADEALAAELASVLEELLNAQGALLELTRRHRSAISRADARAIASCVTDHAAVLASMSTLEARRRSVVARLSAGTRPVKTPTLSELAERVAEPWRARAVDLAARLKDAVRTVQEEQRALKLATESLLAHMDGIVRRVAKALSHAGTYSARGVVEAGRQPVATGLDVAG